MICELALCFPYGVFAWITHQAGVDYFAYLHIWSTLNFYFYFYLRVGIFSHFVERDPAYNLRGAFVTHIVMLFAKYVHMYLY
jgi:hypothetical protein